MGIDGGGTKTLLKIADMSGRPIASGIGGPCNLRSAGAEEIASMLRSLLTETMRKAGVTPAGCRAVLSRDAVVLACMSGGVSAPRCISAPGHLPPGARWVRRRRGSRRAVGETAMPVGCVAAWARGARSR